MTVVQHVNALRVAQSNALSTQSLYRRPFPGAALFISNGTRAKETTVGHLSPRHVRLIRLTPRYIVRRVRALDGFVGQRLRARSGSPNAVQARLAHPGSIASGKPAPNLKLRYLKYKTAQTGYRSPWPPLPFSPPTPAIARHAPALPI